MYKEFSLLDVNELFVKDINVTFSKAGETEMRD